MNGRIHAEIHPHRSDDGGTRSLRFSYSNPPLQQMPSRDEELAPLIRGVFLPEEGEVWAKPDVSQQEFRFIVHYAVKHGLRKAKEAAERYRTDPDTDFHQLVADWTGLERTSAKNINFAKAFGAGVRKFAAMIGKPEDEARAIYDRTTASFRSSGSLPRAAKTPLPSRATSSSTMGRAGIGTPGKHRRSLGPRAWGRARAKRRSAASPIPIIPGTVAGSGAPRPTRR